MGLATVLRRIGANLGFVFGLAIFVLAIAGGTAFTIHRLHAEALASHYAISSTYAHVFEDHLTDHVKLIGALVQSFDADDLGRSPAALSAQLTKTLRQTPALRSLSLLDERNTIVASSNPANVGTAIGEIDLLPRRTGRPDYQGVGRLWSGRDFGQGIPFDQRDKAVAESLPNFIPILAETTVGNRRIALLAAVNPDYLTNNFSLKLRPEEGFVEVLRYDGCLLMTTGDLPLARQVSEVLPQLGRDRESGTFEEVLGGGREVITSFRASRHFPLIVVTHLDRTHVLRKWAEERRLLLVVVAPSLVLVVTLASLLYRRQRRIASERIEARQRDHERLAATVFATVDEAVMVTDANNRIIAVNPAFTAITGFAPDEVLGKDPALLSSGRHSPEFFAKMRRTLQQTGVWQGEIWNRHKNGHQYVEWLSVKQVVDGQGRVTHHVAAFSDITDRKQAEEAQLRAILEASPEAVLLVDAQGKVCYANQVASRVFAYPPDELLGLAVETLVPARSRGRHAQLRADFAHRPRSRPMAQGDNLAAVCKDGREFPAEISLSPITMGDDPFVICSINDITQRIQAEETLRASEERWKFALEGAEEGVWDWSIPTGHVIYSSRIVDFWGCGEVGEPLENRLEDWTRRIHPDDLKAFQRDLNAHLRGETASFSTEHRVERTDGTWAWAHGRGMVVSRSAEGKPLRMIGTYADITARKKIEEDFHDLLHFNQSIIAGSHSGIMVHKHSGQCLLANDAAARITGGTVEQLLARNFHEVFRDSADWHGSEAISAADAALRSGEAVEFESPLLTVFGRSIWCIASFSRLTLKGEHYLLSVFNDISARKEAELAVLKAKEHAEAALGRAQMAERRIIDISEETRKRIGQELHDDLGQHLTGVAFLSEVLHQRLRSEERPEMREAAVITQLINEAVSKTRTLAQGLYPVELQEAGLQALLGQTARNVEAIFKVKCELYCDEGLVVSDLQVQINLFRIAQEAINNAIRHGEATLVRLILTRCNNLISFEISDNGRGFDPGGGDLKSTGGLGTHTMQYRAALIGATLHVFSVKGDGTRVVILLPVTEDSMPWQAKDAQES